MKKEMTPTQKRKLLQELSELMKNVGYQTIELYGYPLSRYNFDSIKKSIKEYQLMNDKM